ncbi:MAG: hypothetical protein ABIH23_24760 [bacterium]
MVILVSLVLIILTFGMYSIKFLPATLHWAVRRGLAVLRAVWFVILVWLCLADPKIVRRETTVLDPFLPVVIDDSTSMDLPTLLSVHSSRETLKTKWETIQEITGQGKLGEELRKRGFEPRTYRLSNLVSGDAPKEGPPEHPSLPATNLTGALKALSTQFTPERCPGFLFLTDGQWNLGGDPLQAHPLLDATPSFGFYAIGIGDPDPPTDIRLASISIPPTVRSGRVATITVYGDAEAVEERIVCPLRLELRTANDEVTWATESSIRFEPGSVRWQRDFRFPAMEAGEFLLMAKITPLGSDINPDNNEMMSDIQILEDRDRVLMVTGGPDWDFKLIKRSLENDPFVTLQAVWLRSEGILRLGDRAWVDGPDGTSPATDERLPGPVEDPLENLREWSIVFLHGLSLGGQRSALRDRIAAFVENGGVAVILPGGSGKTSDLYWPCDPSTTQVALLEEDTNAIPWEVENSSLLAGPILSTLPGDLPPLARSFSLTPAPLSMQVVLGCRSSSGAEQSPLVAEMRYGLGRVVHVYSDSFWRWRMFGTADQDDPFGRFWRVLVHLLSPSSVPTVGRLVVSDPSPRIGQPVKVILELSPDSLAPEGTYFAEIRGPEGSMVLPLAQDPATPLRASADLVPSASGVYQLREGRLGYETRVTVVASEEELLRPAQNVAFLTALAESTGGAYRDAKNWRAVLDSIPVRSATIEREYQRFWASRIWALICIVGLIAAEWFFRQRQGLP